MGILKKVLKIVGKVLLVGLVALVIFLLSQRPRNDRNWNNDQKVLSYAEINDTSATVHNVRANTYRTVDDYDVAYYDKTYKFDDLKKVYFVVEPFSDYKGPAHTFVSFEFAKDVFVSISVEIRKEQGEHFSPWMGMLRQYELTYVVADEKDVVKLRSNFRKDKVFVYPINTTKEKAISLFKDMLGRTNTLREKPEFYNTIFSTCTTNIVRHVNRITPKRIPLSYKVLLPAYSDELAYSLGLIDTDLSFEDAQKKFYINDRAMKYANDPNFSVKIRQ